MKVSTLVAIPVLALAAACGGGGGSAEVSDPKPLSPVEKTLPSISDVLAMMYDVDYQTPDGFFVDERAGTHGSYTIHHVLDADADFELCTDDYSEALAWEEADNASRAVQGQFVASVETSRYFEFARDLAYDASVGNIDSATSPGFARVFRCSYAVRDGVDRAGMDGYAGHINSRPLTSDTLKAFSEYLWQFTFFTTTRKKVLDSFGTTGSGEFRHTLLLGLASRDGDCDRIDVARWVYTSDPDSGATHRRYDVVASYRAKLSGGAPVLCD